MPNPSRAGATTGQPGKRGRVVAFPTQVRPFGRVMKLDEAAEELQVCRRTVEKLIYDGKLVSIRIGRCVRVTEADLNRYIESLVAEARHEFGGSLR